MRQISLSLLLMLACLAANPAHGAACSSPAANEADRIYNQAYHTWQFCNGTSWKAFAGNLFQQVSTGSGCTNPHGNEADQVYNATYHTWEFCNGTNWEAFGAYGASSSSGQQLPWYYGTESGYVCCGYFNTIISDGTYFYEGEYNQSTSNQLLAFTFTTHAWTLKSNMTTYLGGGAVSMWYQGGYLYVAENSAGGGTSGIEAWSFNGTTFTKAYSYTTSVNPQWIWGDGTYIYVADDTNGLKAFSSSLSLLATYGPTQVSGINVVSVMGDGTYIYITDNGHSKIRTLTYSGGASFTVPAGTSTISGKTTNPGGLFVEGSYIYVGSGSFYVYTYNGTSFTTVGSLPVSTLGNYAQDVEQIYVKNSIIYFGISTMAYAFNTGTGVFTFLGTLPVLNLVGNSPGQSFWSDGTYVYWPDSASSSATAALSIVAWPVP